MHPDQKVYDAIMVTTGKRFKTSRADIQGYFDYPYPQRLFVLREALVEIVLKEYGDYRQFLELIPQIRELSGHDGDDLEQALIEMCQWLAVQTDLINAAREQVPLKNNLVISLLLWGDKFVERAEKFLFKSWLAPDNIEYLKGKTLFIHTDAATLARLDMLPIVQQLHDNGLTFVHSIIPDSLVTILKGVNKMAPYWMIGCSAALSLNYCKKVGAAFHQAFPDTIYSGEYFKTLSHLGKIYPVILQTCFRTDETVMAPAVKPYDDGKCLNVSSADLAAHALNSIHLSEYWRLVNNRTRELGYPNCHRIVWESPNSLYINSPHYNSSYLSQSFVAGLRDRFYASFDSEIDHIIKTDDFYITREADAMFVTELSDQRKGGISCDYIPLIDFSRQWWQKILYRDLLKFFNRGMIIRFNDKIRQSPKAMKHEQIEMERQIMANTMLATNPFKQYDLTEAA